MKSLILAAGKGERLRRQGRSKPLIPVLGIPLIERVIYSAIESGADDLYVVTGHEGEKVRSFLEELGKHLAVRITPLVSSGWERGNGVSLLTAQEVLDGPFLLLMGDHIFDPRIVRSLIDHPLPDEGIALAVDKDIHNRLVDMNDVTRVRVEDGKIRNIGKGIPDFNGFDTGLFFCSPALFNAAEESIRLGDPTITGAVRVLAREGHAEAVPVSGFWIDVDDPPALNRAEKGLLRHLRDKQNDGPVSRFLNRPISAMLSRRLARTDLTPNQISLFSFFLSLIAAGLFVMRGYLPLLFGGILAQSASIIDGCDGEVARLKYQTSEFGGWFDAVLDRYSDAFLLFGLTWHLLAETPSGLVLFTGFLAIIGSFMLSYTADKYDGLMRRRIEAAGRPGLRIGRDIRIFLIFIGAVTNQALLALAAIAVLMNLETIRRIGLVHVS